MSGALGLLLTLVVSLLLAIALVVGVIVLGAWWFSTPPYRGPVSDHFDGRRFRNLPRVPHNEFRDVAKWMSTRRPGAWEPYRDVPPGPRPLERVAGDRLLVTVVNHTTVLVQTRGLNILTDPVWAERCGPLPGVGPRRVRPPGIRFEELPPIDVVLLSHNHYDHCDVGSLRRLARSHAPRLVVPLGCRTFLEGKDVHVAAELDWWHSVEIADGVAVHAVPARHFSGRGGFDRDRSLWAGFVVTTPAGNVYFAGDSGFGDHFAAIGERFDAPRVALLPIGAYRPEWFMSRVHVSPDESMRAHDIVRARLSIATHFGTFRLADDGETEAADRIRALVTERGEGRAPFVVPTFGEAIEVP